MKENDIPIEFGSTPIEWIGDKALYKPSIRSAKREGIKTGNVKKYVVAMEANNKSELEINEGVKDITISSILKNNMSMPNNEYIIGDTILNNAEVIGKVLIEKAISGDMSAIREVLNRTEGKVPNITKNANLNIKGNAGDLTSLMNSIDKNRSE